MAKFTVHKTQNYTVMSNYHFRNNSLSFKAMGLLSFMLSLPDDWDFSVEGLAHCARDGRDSISAGLKELEEAGHLVRRQVRGERGRIIDTEYDLYEEPIIDTSGSMSRKEYATSQLEEERPLTDFPKVEKSELPEIEEKEESIENTASLPVTDFPEVVDDKRILPVTEKPLTVNPPTEKPLTENPQQINTNIINTKLISTKERNTDDRSSSLTKDILSVRNRLDYHSAVQATSKVLVDEILRELLNHQEILNSIDAKTFKNLCSNIALFSAPIVNKSAYISKCIKNIQDAMEINKTTLNETTSLPERQKSEQEIGCIRITDNRNISV